MIGQGSVGETWQNQYFDVMTMLTDMRIRAAARAWESDAMAFLNSITLLSPGSGYGSGGGGGGWAMYVPPYKDPFMVRPLPAVVVTGANAHSTPWMEYGFSQLGQREISPGNNPNIISFHATTGRFLNDETPWCSSYVNWSMKQAGVVGTNSARAYSWLVWGVPIDKPAYGAIAIMNFSHVGFVVGVNKDGRIIILGGNQGTPGSVNLTPVARSAVISYRYPNGFIPSYQLVEYNLLSNSLNLILTR